MTTRVIHGETIIPDDGGAVVTLTAGQLRALLEAAYDDAYRAAATRYAQAGADAAVRSLAEQDLIRTSPRIEVATIVRDETGRITGVVKEQRETGKRTTVTVATSRASEGDLR
jgi:PII-like signaling protein